MGQFNYEILNEVSELLPRDALIVDTVFECANIVLYSKNKRFILECGSVIRKIVDTIKKRVEVRADQSILLPVDKSDKIIRSLIPEDAGIDEVWFDEKRSVVVIEALKPGIAIGKDGEIIRKIQEKTFWTPRVRRSPAIKSDLIKTIRLSIYRNSSYRRKFLHNLGKKIYSGFERRKNYWVRVSCLGGAREVGRSCFLLHTPESKVLIDCGVNVASEDKAFPHLEAPELDIKHLDAVVVTHSHLDHCALVPLLFKYGYRGPVFTTEPTRDIMTLLMIDYIDVTQKEKGTALYGITDIKEMIKHVVTLNYGEVTDVTSDVRLTLLDAGHVLGSSLAHFNIGDGFHNLLYTADFKFEPTTLLSPAHTQFQRVETVIMESTYGSVKDIKPTRQQCKSELLKIVNSTLKGGGKVLLPVLGVGRAQEIMVILEQAMRNNKIPNVPIFVDGMVWDVTAIHTAYPEFFNRKISARIFGKGDNPFLSDVFRRVGSQKERVDIIERHGPCILLATSGMLVGGPSVFYVENLADNHRNSLVLTCYQGPGSLGRKLQEGDNQIVKKEGRRVITIPVKLTVKTIEGFSGHSSRPELINYVGKLKPKPRRVILVHGEKSKTLDLASSIHQKYYVETSAPRNLDVLRIR